MNRYVDMLNIESYRGIRNLKLKDMGNINILVGDNNAGKTSVLEAIQLICDPSVYNLLQVAIKRSSPYFLSNRRLNKMESLIYMFDQEHSDDHFGHNSFQNLFLTIHAMRNGEWGTFRVEGQKGKSMMVSEQLPSMVMEESSFYSFEEAIDAETESFRGHMESTFASCQCSKQIEIDRNSKPFRPDEEEKHVLNHHFVQAFDHIIGDSFSDTIKTISNKEKAVSLLKYFDKDIVDLRYINEKGRYIPVVENKGKGTLPLAIYGDGMKKVLTLLNAVISAQNGVVLIDEFETAIHTSVMEKSYRFILKVANELKVQVFMTTHSLEAVDKLLEAGSDQLEDIRVVRLKKDGDNTYARVLNGTEAREDRTRFDMELRI
ncbi:MAG: AAA family ATPase [Bacillota bacterium]|nr:AAA family ATPase [Bacillota bacterium]